MNEVSGTDYLRLTADDLVMKGSNGYNYNNCPFTQQLLYVETRSIYAYSLCDYVRCCATWHDDK